MGNPLTPMGSQQRGEPAHADGLSARNRVKMYRISKHPDDIKCMCELPWSQGQKADGVTSTIEKRVLEASCGGAAAVIQQLLAQHW